MGNPIDYLMIIESHKDNLKIQFTGSEVKMGPNIQDQPHTIRPHHIRIVAQIQELMREYYLKHKDGK